MLFKSFWHNIRKRFLPSSGLDEDPERRLETIVLDMQEDLIIMRQAVAQLIATQKRTERTLSQANNEVAVWQKRSELALERGDETLAKESLRRKIDCQTKAALIKEQFETCEPTLNTVKSALKTLEIEISKLKAKRDLFIARVRFLEVSGDLLTHQYGFSSLPNSVFQKLEQDLSRLVSQANPSKNIYDTVYDIDAELEAIKKRMNDS